MKSEKSAALFFDEAREIICHRFARMLHTGSFSVRVRIVTVLGKVAAVWFYAHRSDGWHKGRDPITHPQLVRALEDTLNMLASKGHAEQWSARKHSGSDYHDVDVQFHRRKLATRLGDELESALAGLLFRDAHHPTKDERRSIRPPRAGRLRAERA
jgi:hypothetical protein